MMSFVRVAVEVNDFVDTATAAMGRSRVSAAPVLDDTGRLVGLVTASHLTLAWLDAELHPVRTFFPPIWRRSCPTVGAVMSSPAVSLTPGADLSQVTDMFRDQKVDCVLIVDGMSVRGIVFRADVAARLRATS